MSTLAIVLEEPERLRVKTVGLLAAGSDDVVVDVDWSGISTGTERLLYTGRMPSFPGMGYPLVPGYEAVGRVVSLGEGAAASHGDVLREGASVFVPGARCFEDARGLFGAAARRLHVPAARVVPLPATAATTDTPESSVLIALAATAWHALSLPGVVAPELIVGHGVLGRLLARLCILRGHAAPTVWESDRVRREGSFAYPVTTIEQDTRTDYSCIVDVSGVPTMLDTLVGRLARGGEIVLAGFYAAPLSLNFPPAFMREARFRISAEWAPADIEAVSALVASGRLELGDLVSETRPAGDAPVAYRTAFEDSACLKMILDWREVQ